MERVIQILMRRDGINRFEATELCEQTAELLQEAIDEGHFMEVDEILKDELGLEPDYVFDLIETL